MDSNGYQQLFFSTIQRAPGQPADDYEQVLGASGIPKGLPPYQVPDASMPLHAMTQQIGSDGRIAGRIFLPTAQPDSNGYFSHPFSPLRDGPTPGSLLWEWRDLGGPPVVDPTGADSGGGSSPGGGGGLTESQVEAMIAAATKDMIKVGDKIALVSSGDAGSQLAPSLLCAEGGGPKASGQPFTLTSRDGTAPPGAWESWEVKRGQ